MKRLTRYQQSAVILSGIVILLLCLWFLLTHPHGFGGVGEWAGGHIFGPSTLRLAGGGAAVTMERAATEGPGFSVTTLDEAEHPVTNAAGSVSNRTSNSLPAAVAPRYSTNLLRSNGPITTIAMDPADLVETPPGVVVGSNTTEAATIAERLGQASAKGGDIQISLSWNNYNDLDLHCLDPKGEEIWFSHPYASTSHGELDVDRNAHPPFTAAPVENIYWPLHQAPPGEYKIFVVFYSPRNGLDPSLSTPFTVRTVVRGWKTYFFRSTISFSGRQERKLICTLQYDPANPDPDKRFHFVQ